VLTQAVHPLDVVDDNFKILDKSGNHVCIGAFQPITSAFSLFGNFDMIMGMTFRASPPSSFTLDVHC
jgi:hypothetical protein